MTYGRKVCNTLKEIRQQIADKNEIEYTTSECHFEGECEGTCPKCESELQYLENELHRRTQLGKAVAVAGISLGMAGTFSACNTPLQANTTTSAEQEMKTNTENPDTVLTISKNGIKFIPPDTLEMNDIFRENVIERIEGDVSYPYERGTKYAASIYPGGGKALDLFLYGNLVYPKEAKEQNIIGRVVIGFIIEKDGSLTDFTVLRSVHPLLDEEALRVVKLIPKWKRGKELKKNIGQRYIVSIFFSPYGFNYF